VSASSALTNFMTPAKTYRQASRPVTAHKATVFAPPPLAPTGVVVSMLTTQPPHGRRISNTRGRCQQPSPGGGGRRPLLGAAAPGPGDRPPGVGGQEGLQPPGGLGAELPDGADDHRQRQNGRGHQHRQSAAQSEPEPEPNGRPRPEDRGRPDQRQGLALNR